MWDVACLCVLCSYRCKCILAGLIEHYAMQRLSCSVTHRLCSPVTHAHTHTDQMTGTWSKLLGTLQVLAHIVQFLCICPQFCLSLSVFLSHSVFVSLHQPICSSALHQSNKCLLWTHLFLCLLPHRDQLCIFFQRFQVVSS